MNRKKSFKQAIVSVLCLSICLSNVPVHLLHAQSSEVTLSDGTIIRDNPDGTQTAIISVDPEVVTLMNEAEEAERLKAEGRYLRNVGNEVDTRILAEYDEEKELVTIAHDDTSISFRPLFPEQEETEKETDMQPEADEAETELQQTEAETAAEPETELIETESEIIETEIIETEIIETENDQEVASETHTESETATAEQTTEPITTDSEIETAAAVEAALVAETEKQTESQIEDLSESDSEASETEPMTAPEETETQQITERQTEKLVVEESETNRKPAEQHIESKERETEPERETETEAAEVEVIAEKQQYQNGTYGSIIYRNLFDESTDVSITARKKGIKEDIILNEYKEQPTFDYEITLNGLNPALEEGKIYLRDGGGAVKAIIDAPYMIDANQAYSEDIEVSLHDSGSGTYVISYRPNDAWLRSDERVYPVVIDPTVTYTSDHPNHLEDNYVTAQDPNTNHYYNETYFKVGNDGSKTHRAYIRPAIPDSLKSVASKVIIKEASIRMYESSGRSSNQDFSIHMVTGGEWNSREITYKNAPKFTSKAYQTKKIRGGGWVTWDLKEMFSEWFNTFDQQPNYGFALVADKETAGDSRTFNSADTFSNGMTFSVTYYVDIDKPEITAVAKGSGVNTGTGYIDLSWNRISGAESYYVGIFNGKDYEYFFVGSKRTFTTKGKGIWPTEAEINKGRYKLHSDGKGAELPMIPAFTYANVKNGSYSDSLQYYFKVVPCNEYGQAPNPGLFSAKRLTLPDTMPPNQAAAVSVNPSGYTNWKNLSVSWSGVTDFGTTSTSVVSTLGKGRIQYSIDGTNNWKDTDKNTASGSFSFDASGLKDGTHGIYIRGRDEAGNTGAAKGCNFYIDRTGPTKPVLSVVPQSWTKGGSIQLSWSSISDLNNLKQVDYAIDNGGWKSTSRTEKAYNGYQISIAALADGIHTIKVRGTDILGNVGVEETIRFYKDTKAPTVGEVTLEPDSWSNLEQLKVNWKEAKDPHSGLKKIAYAIDEGNFINVSEVKKDGELLIDISSLEDGAHKLILTFSDDVGNQLKKEYSFYRDTQPPELAITAPLSGDLVNGNLEIWGSVKDISLTEWTVKALGEQSGAEAMISGTETADQELLGVLDLREFTDGENITLTLHAVDQAGNENEVSGIVIKVDKSAKQIEGLVSLQKPGAGEAIRTPQYTGSYQKDYQEEENEGYYYVDGVFQGYTTAGGFDFDAITYQENSLHSISLISRGESGKLYYSKGLAAYLIMSDVFTGQEQGEIITEVINCPKEILALRLHATEELPDGTAIEYYYSLDQGTTWQPIINNADEPLLTGTKSVMLKAVLQGDGVQLPKLYGWTLEAVIEMSPSRVVSRLMNEVGKLNISPVREVAATPFTVPVTPDFANGDKKFLFVDDVIHGSSWSYNALSAPERSEHMISALALKTDGTLFGSGIVKNELLLRENVAVDESGEAGNGNHRQIESTSKLYGIRMLALTDSGVGRFFYSIDDQTTWTEIESGEYAVFGQASERVWLKSELPADTVLQAWHLEGVHVTGNKAFVQLLKKPINVAATDYKNIYQDNKDRKYEITWQDPNGKAKGSNYTTKYRIYRSGRYLATTDKLSYTDKNYQAGASYEVEVERIYENPSGTHVNYLNRVSEKAAAQKVVLAAEKKIDAAKHKVEDIKQSEGLDKLYGGNYTFSDNKKAPKDEAALNERLLGKSNYCVAGFEPINFNTGNFFMEAGDYERSDYGENKLEILRTYNTQSTVEDGPFGGRWEFEYGQRLVFYQDNKVGYRKADGALLIFTKDQAGEFSGEDTQGFNLKENRKGSGYVITQADSSEYYFTSGGLLEKIERAGFTTELKRNKKGVLTEIIAPSGAKLKLKSDKKGHIVKITTAENEELNYQYEGKNLTAFTDAQGHTTKYVYDSKGRMTEWYDADNVRQVMNRYDEKSRVTYQEDARDGEYTLEYFDDHTVTTDAEGAKYEVYFDEKKRTVKEIDGVGNEILHSYNEDGYLSGKTDSSGRLTSYEYDNNGNVIKEIQPDGSTILMTYDENNRQTSVTDQNGHTTRYKLDQNGNRIEEQHPDGSVTRYQYNEKDQLIKETNELGYVTTYEYREDQLVAQTDPLGNKTTFEYDEHGNKTAEIDALQQKTEYQYDEKGNLSKLIFPDGASESYTYDELGREASYQDPAGNTTKYQYDGLGNMLSETAPDGTTRQTEYSLSNQPVKVTDENGASITYKYDGNGNKIEQRDALGNVTKYQYDEAGNQIKEVLPTGAEIFHEYDQASGRLIGSTDQSGRRMKYEFDKAGNLIKLTEVKGGTVSYTYDERNRLIKEVNESGGVTTHTYNEAGWCIETVNPLGARTAYEYDENGNTTRITDALGNTQEFTYDSLGRMIKTTNQKGQTTEFTYDKRGNIQTQTDAEGNVNTYEYDQRGNLVKSTDPLKNVMEYAYDSKNNQTEIIQKNGAKSTNHYDPVGYLLKETDVLGNSVEYEYNAAGLVTKVTDAKGYTAVYEYDALNNIKEIVLDGKGKTVYEYDAAGNVTSITDELGAKKEYRYNSRGFISEEQENDKITRYKYDKAGNLSSLSTGEGAELKFKYDKAGQLSATVYPDGSEDTIEYDLLGRKIKETTSEGEEKSYQYDALGNLTESTEEGKTTSYEYDALNRVSRIVYPDGSEEAFTYDALGNITREKNELGEETVITYDEQSLVREIKQPGGAKQVFERDLAGRVIAETDGEGNTKCFGYDAFGNLTEVEDALGNKTEYEYGVQDKITKVTDALNRITEYEYDVKGNLLREKDAAGNVTAYEYTSDGLMAKMIKPDGSRITYSYDDEGRIIEEDHDGKEKIHNNYNEAGRLITAEGKAGKSSYQYDPDGKILSVTSPDNQTVSYTYDEKGRKTAVVYPDGSEVAYSYDETDRLKTVTGLDGEVTEYEYDQAGRRTRQKGSNLETIYEYDPAGNLTRQKTTGETDLELIYSYNRNSNITEEVKKTDGKELKSTFEYDQNNQLSRFTRSDGYEESYRYDSVGNMVAKVIGKDETEMTYNELNQLVEMKNENGSIRYSYDLNGNLIEKQLGDQKDSYTYSPDNRLIGFTGHDGYAKEYVYDTNGNLIAEREKGQADRETLEDLIRTTEKALEKEGETNSDLPADQQPETAESDWVTTEYVNDLTQPYYQVLTETRKGSNINYEYGLERLSAYNGAEDPQEKMSYLHDVRGSVRQTVTAAGVAEQEYSPYGELLGGVKASGFGYTGEAYDAATGSVNLRMRRYEPAIGRFNQRDVLKGISEEPISLNPYPYVKNDPVNYVDPSGMFYNPFRPKKPTMPEYEYRKVAENPDGPWSVKHYNDYQDNKHHYDKGSGGSQYVPGTNKTRSQMDEQFRQSARAQSEQRKNQVVDTVKKAAGANGKLSADDQKIIDKYSKEAERLHKEGKLTEGERNRLIREACKELDKESRKKHGDPKKKESHIKKEFLLKLSGVVSINKAIELAKAALAGAGSVAGTVYVLCNGAILVSLIIYNETAKNIGYKTPPTTAREAVAAGADYYYDADTGQKVFLEDLSKYRSYDRDVEKRVADWESGAKEKSKQKSKEKEGSKSKDKSDYSKQTKEQLEKAEKSFEKLIKEHEQKLKDYKKNPYKHDNKGYLRKAPTKERVEQIIKGRIEALEKQIKKQKGELKRIREYLKKKR